VTAERRWVCGRADVVARRPPARVPARGERTAQRLESVVDRAELG
jgi:hypothetical protein